MKELAKALAQRRRLRITPATVISMVALVFAAGGGAYATTSLSTATIAGWAVVGPNGHLARKSGAVSSKLIVPGSYQVVFNSNVSSCSYKATIGQVAAGVPSVGDIGVASRAGNPNAVFVRETNLKGAGANFGFHLVVVC